MKTITIAKYTKKSKEEFNDFVNGTSCCTRCGNSHPFRNKYLNSYLLEFQLLAGQSKLPYPTKLQWSFYVTSSEEVIEHHIFKKPIHKNIEYGDGILELEFNQNLSEQEIKDWSLITKGAYAIMHSIL